MTEINSDRARIRKNRPRTPRAHMGFGFGMSRFRRRCVAWLAMVAMLFGTVAPAVGRALVPDTTDRFLADVCSVAGTGSSKIGNGQASGYGRLDAKRDTDSRPPHSADRCPHCCSHPGAAALPHRANDPLFAAPLGAPLPRNAVAVPGARDVWSPSHPRAPPTRG